MNYIRIVLYNIIELYIIFIFDSIRMRQCRALMEILIQRVE